MPDFQSFNYAALQPQDNGRNLLEALQQGLQTGGMPFQMRRQAQSEELANALKRMQVQNEPENERLKQDLLRGQIQQIQNPRPTEFEQKMKLLQQYLSGQNPLQNDVNGQPQNPNGVPQNADKIRESFIKNLLGIPLETEEEKYDRTIKEYEDKKKIDRKYQNTEDKYDKDLKFYEDKKRIDQKYQKPASDLTTATLTSNQKIIQAADNILPVIEKLVNLNNGPLTFDPYTNRLAKQYQKTTIETMMGALNLPSSDKGIKTVEEIVERKWGESAASYNKRLKELAIDISERRQKAEEANKTGKLYDGKADAKRILKSFGATKFQIDEIFGEGEEEKKSDPLGIR